MESLSSRRDMRAKRGLWSLESGVWSLESGVWSLESGLWRRSPEGSTPGRRIFESIFSTGVDLYFSLQLLIFFQR
jgi:hypothetical protein